MRLVPEKTRRLIEEIAPKHNLDPDLVEAICMKESSGNTLATRYEPAFYKTYVANMDLPEEEKRLRSTSIGLMQVMGQVAREHGFKGPLEDLLKPEICLEYGCKHLAKKIEKYSIPGGIAAYNAGNVRRKDNGTYVNQYYVDKVKEYLMQIKET